MWKRVDDKRPSVEELQRILARGQDLLERAQHTLQQAERVHAEVSTHLAPPPPPPDPVAPGPQPITFPWPPEPSSGEADRALRARGET